MRDRYVRAMDGLYVGCVGIAGLTLLLITLIIPWGVFTRYVLNTGSAWPEPMAILLMVIFTFLGAAACYRANAHIAVTLLVRVLTGPVARSASRAVDLLLLVLAAFMVWWGIELCLITWPQVIAEFPFLSVGVTYLPIPVGGVVLGLFIVERLWVGLPAPDSIVFRDEAEAVE